MAPIQTHFREWTRETIKLIRYDGAESKLIDEIDNPIGEIPAVYLPANRSIVRGIEISDILTLPICKRLFIRN